MDFGAASPVVDDRWELLAEICNEGELALLSMLAAGMTHDEVAGELNCHVSTITLRLNKIRAKVQRQRDRDGDV